MTEYSVNLIFETDKRESLTITVPKAKPDVTGQEAAGAMRRVIEAGCVSSAAGDPVAIQGAELVETSVVDYDLA